MNDGTNTGEYFEYQARLATVGELIRSRLHPVSPITITRNLSDTWKTLHNDVVKLCIVAPTFAMNLFVKLNRRKHDPFALKQEAIRTRLFLDVFTALRPEFNSVEVFDYFEDPQALLLHECRGYSLLELIRRGGLWLSHDRHLRMAEHAARGCGEWTRRLEHASKNPVSARHVLHYFQAEARQCADRLQPLRSWGWQRWIDHSVDIILSDSISDTGTYLAHGDLHPGNLFITSDTVPCITAIDLNLSMPRFFAYDALYFDHQLRHFFPVRTFRPKFIHRILRAFWTGYAKEVSPSIRRFIRAHLLLKSLVLLSTLAKQSSAPWSWRHFVEGMKIARDFDLPDLQAAMPGES